MASDPGFREKIFREELVERIERTIEGSGLTIVEFAKAMKISRQGLYQVLGKKVRLSVAMAVKLDLNWGIDGLELLQQQARAQATDQYYIQIKKGVE